MAHFGPTRRSLLQGTLAASALSLTGFPTRAEPQWKKYAGTTIEANLIKGPRGELLQKYASEFTDLTGIKVESEVIRSSSSGKRPSSNSRPASRALTSFTSAITCRSGNSKRPAGSRT